MTQTQKATKTPVLDWFGKLFATLGALLILGIWVDHFPAAIAVTLAVASWSISALFMWASILKGERKS